MKVAKEKRPSRSHTLLGVLWTIVKEGVWTRALVGGSRAADLLGSRRARPVRLHRLLCRQHSCGARAQQGHVQEPVSRGDFSEAQQLGCRQLEPQFEQAWQPLLRLQQEPASLQAWDFQSVVDGLFAEPPHSEVGEGAR